MNDDKKDVYLIIGIFLLLIGGFIVLVFLNTANQRPVAVEAKPTTKPIPNPKQIIDQRQAPQYSAPLADNQVSGTRAYKWVDKEGGMHFSERPPTDPSIPHTIVVARTDLNVVQGVNPAEVLRETNVRVAPSQTGDILEATLQAHEQQCAWHTKGSIAYRDCRRQVHLALKDACFQYKGTLNRASAEEYSGLKDQADRYCYAYEHFLVVD